MRKKASKILVLSTGILLIFLSGCKRIADWTVQNFPQGKTTTLPVDTVKPYIKTMAIHSKLSTVAIFDALWLSDIVRSAYVEVTTVRSGKTKEQYQTLLRRQLEENKHFITFYLLSEYDVPVGDTADWQVFLKIKDNVYQPRELRMVDLAHEYRALFGQRFNKFKVAYLVKFGAQDIDENPLVSSDTTVLSLCLHSTRKQVEFNWHIGPWDYNMLGHI